MTVEMRGAAFFTFLDALGQLRGPATVAAVRAALPVSLREQLDRGALTRVGWYPLSAYAALHTANDSVVRGGEALAFQIGRLTTEVDTRGLIRFVLAIASPDLLMRHASLVFGSYIRGATVTAEALAPRHCSVRWKGLEGATRLLLAEMEGGTAFLVERTGGKHVQVSTLSAKSPSEGGFEVRWE